MLKSVILGRTPCEPRIQGQPSRSKISSIPGSRPSPSPTMTMLTAFALLLLASCGPQISDLERGEEGRVAPVFNGDTLLLEDGTRVFLAEIDAPSGEAAYAAQSQGELEALALHREVLLTYGGERRWVGRPREGEEAPREAAIAHVFVKSEGGRWFWLQHELVSRGAAVCSRAAKKSCARS